MHVSMRSCFSMYLYIDMDKLYILSCGRAVAPPRHRARRSSGAALAGHGDRTVIRSDRGRAGRTDRGMPSGRVENRVTTARQACVKERVSFNQPGKIKACRLDSSRTDRLRRATTP
jgi:hypothetical protein